MPLMWSTSLRSSRRAVVMSSPPQVSCRLPFPLKASRALSLAGLPSWTMMRVPGCVSRWLKLLHNQDGNEPLHLSSWMVVRGDRSGQQ